MRPNPKYILPREDVIRIFREIYDKVLQRGNFRITNATFMAFDNEELEVYVDAHPVRAEPCYTIVVLKAGDHRLVGVSKRHPNDTFNPEIGFRMAVHRALTSTMQS